MPPRGVDGRVAEAVGAEQQQFVIAHQGPAVAAGRRGLRGKLHDEFDDADAVGAAVGEVAEEPQPGAARRPVALVVDESVLAERGQQLVEVAVHIADDVQRSRALRPFTGCLRRVGEHRQVAGGGGVVGGDQRRVGLGRLVRAGRGGNGGGVRGRGRRAVEGRDGRRGGVPLAALSCPWP